jgi:polyphosphate:AMP phosphotransferase
MFETAELGRKIAREQYKEKVPTLRTQLLEVQDQLSRAGFSVLIVVGGVDGAGKGEVVNLINEWLDARLIDTMAFDEPSDEENHRPPYWRYWMALPARGRIGLFTGAYYTQPIIGHAVGRDSDAELGAALARANAFEKALADDGTLIIKLWLHISKEQQKKRFKELEKNPETRWRIGKRDWKHAEHYDAFRRTCERAIRETSTGEAPWLVIDSADRRYRNVAVATHLLERIRSHAADREPAHAPRQESAIEDPDTILDRLDLGLTLSDEVYEHELAALQGRLNRLSQQARRKQIGVTLVFEGADAAGKGGAIRRIMAALDARQARVIQIAAPSDEEKAHHYLWRFWRHLPRLGRFTIYDRSWYGRVLVERVEGFAREREWMRAYREINAFEEQLTEFGIVLVKFWLHISPEEQLRRFEEREAIPYKRHKITAEDYRNRAKANNYEAAANEMVERSSSEYAPWTLVEAEDKRYARVKVLREICDRIEGALRSRAREEERPRR